MNNNKKNYIILVLSIIIISMGYNMYNNIIYDKKEIKTYNLFQKKENIDNKIFYNCKDKNYNSKCLIKNGFKLNKLNNIDEYYNIEFTDGFLKEKIYHTIYKKGKNILYFTSKKTISYNDRTLEGTNIQIIEPEEKYIQVKKGLYQQPIFRNNIKKIIVPYDLSYIKLVGGNLNINKIWEKGIKQSKYISIDNQYVVGDNKLNKNNLIPILKTVKNCIVQGEIIYGTKDGTDKSLTCGNDIIICSGKGIGYTISSCNVGTKTPGITYDSYGELFQWGNNSGIKTAPTSKIQIGLTTNNSTYYNNKFISGDLIYPYDWTFIKNNNLWGDITNTNIARRGPCNLGYHIPTKSEFLGLHNAGGWGLNGSNMLNALKLPMGGLRYWEDSNINLQGSYGFYWSSSPKDNYGYTMSFTSNYIAPTFNGTRSFGYSIRCFKN